MDTIGRINVKARNWLEHITLEKWALSHDGRRRYRIMTTNMSRVFNGVLKGAHNLPITTLVQLTFYGHGASRLASGEEFTPYIEAKMKVKVVKSGSHEVVLYDHVAGRFHVKTRHSVGNSNRKPHTYHVTLQTRSCTYIIVSCQFIHILLISCIDVHANMDTPLFPARLDPEDTSVLTLQHRHRSSTICVDPNMVLDDRIRPYITQSEFYVFHRVGHVKVDWPLITALVERWRPKTHTFHMPGIPLTSPINSDLHSIYRCGRPQFDWRLYHENYMALWEVGGDHIVTTKPIEPHMDYHAPYITWYRRFITPILTSIISRGGHALEDSDSDVCHTGIVDIIRMATDVMCIIWKDHHIAHVKHGGDLPLMQHPTYTDLPSVQPLTSLDPPSIDTSTQVDLQLVILRGRRGLCRPRLLPPPPPLFPAPTPSQTDVLHVSHAVPASVREKRLKRKRVPVTHRFSPCGDM
ncbi:hypothetical protein AAG906_038957 [Vitis piasezkii]